jgi:hypothetical protein
MARSEFDDPISPVVEEWLGRADQALPEGRG